jgi:outer membrane protein
MDGRFLASLSLALAVAGFAAQAGAETLDEAMGEAYANNPQLQSQRANLRATDEAVPQALSGWRPTVLATGTVGREHTENTPGVVSSTAPPTVVIDPNTIDLNITQPIYQGGQTVAKTAAAEAQVESQRATTVATESTVLFGVAQAYFDVVRDQSVVQLNINNEQVLRRQLEATNDEFRVGAATRTDVAQAEARLAAATATREQAEGTLQTSRAEYVRAVGHAPPVLTPTKLRPILPATRDEALSLAAIKNPNVVAAVFTEDSARDTVTATRAQLLPSLNLIGDINRGDETVLQQRETTAASVIAKVTMPLYEAGLIYSQTRQAQENVAMDLGQTDNARRMAVQLATQAWETIQSARASIVSLQSTIKAAQIALEGVRQEQQVGSRTVLDVLSAEQEIFTDEVNPVTTQHDIGVAEFNRDQQVGTLTAIDLKLPVTLYDVDVHYKSVRNKWLGFGGKDQ